MLNITSGAKSAGKEEKRNGRISQPVKLHELFGQPKSTGKKDALNVEGAERPRSQPVRIKELFALSNSSQKFRKNGPDWRMTTVPNATSHIRRKLYESSKDQTSSCNQSRFAFNDSSPLESGCRQGLSKSDGKMKLAGLRRNCMEPEDMKDFLKSWENVQTVPHAAPTTKMEVRNQNVRRKLYSMSHSSPFRVGSKNDRKHEISGDKVKSQKSCAAVKFESRKSIANEQSGVSRRSRIPAPNTIRDKYAKISRSEVITEEPTLLSSSLESEARTMDCAKIPNEKETSMEADKFVQENEPSNSGNEVFPNVEKIEERQPKQTETPKLTMTKQFSNEISRPTVIMAVSAKGTRTDGGESHVDSVARDNSEVPDSLLPLKESPLKELPRENTTRLRERMDEPNTSMEDLLGNSSHRERGESIFFENLPRDSFLKTPMKTGNFLISVDRQTLQWMHGNLTLAVQSTEEQLFSMKRMLETLEEMMKDQCDSKPREEPKVTNLEKKDDQVTPPVSNEAEKQPGTRPENVEEMKHQEVAIDSPEIPSPPEDKIETLTNDREESVLENDDVDKENCAETLNAEKPLRRSPRLSKKWSCSPKNQDDSFSLAENELNIVHANKPKRSDTPLKRKLTNRIDPRSRKSIREYMALKSSINFLATPDANGILSPGVEKDTPSNGRMTRRSLSRKLLTELEDLYGDSPI